MDVRAGATCGGGSGRGRRTCGRVLGPWHPL